MKIYGLIGYPLVHSFSRSYFNLKFQTENLHDCEYKNFEIQNISSFPELIKNTPSLSGLSVTIPHKETVMQYLNEINEDARKIGAVNAIQIKHIDNQIYLKGFNTDYIAFYETIKPFLKPHHNKALILGTGGSSKSVAYALKKLNIPYVFVSRKKNSSAQYTYDEIDEKIIKEHTVIVNTTPLGMFPHVDYYPHLHYHYITSKHILFDLIYNPSETIFLKFGKENGALTINGLKMLHNQAEKAWEIFSAAD